jgi:hypothetical protein
MKADCFQLDTATRRDMVKWLTRGKIRIVAAMCVLERWEILINL